MKTVILGKYLHYKGNYYVVIDIATHSETDEQLVVYRREDDMRLWVRPLTMFVETVHTDAGTGPRFKKVSD